ncbi:polyisoprenoid-binding protein [Gluconobacter thailandicus]|uniref:YceI family protein n=1 Tax=Gluconobacter thailandicus TaxID=257438 RepID=UPI000776F6AA|nr:YceI family protein [Gluconobacter thailandicus]KXV35208.1 polyisoprenoid-binding protein [Gluconobacter thailandicus]
MKTILSGAVAALSLTLAATSALAAAPADVKSGTYKVEAGHTQVNFSVLHFGFTYYSGQFSNVSGSLKLDAAHPSASKLSVTIPVSSVATSSTVLTDELKNNEWFDATKYPDATFVSTEVSPAGAEDAVVSGNLTLHGVTKPVVLHVHFVGAGMNPMDKAYTVGFQATGTIHRSDFGVKKYVPYVSDDVNLTIAGAFEKQP